MSCLLNRTLSREREEANTRRRRLFNRARITTSKTREEVEKEQRKVPGYRQQSMVNEIVLFLGSLTLHTSFPSRIHVAVVWFPFLNYRSNLISNRMANLI